MTEQGAMNVEELRERLEKGEQYFFINLTHHQHSDLSLMKARGALVSEDNRVERYLDQVPRDRPVVVYATCPGDDTSFRAAEILRSHGIGNVHVLIGGFAAYVGAGLPVEPASADTIARKNRYL